MEYLVDYASPATRAAGVKRISEELARLPEGRTRQDVAARLDRIRHTPDRDFYF
jgi:2-iminoacetate synthase